MMMMMITTKVTEMTIMVTVMVMIMVPKIMANN
jgi:hypothetical protein